MIDNWLAIIASSGYHLHLPEVHGAVRIHQSLSSNRYGRYRILDRPNPVCVWNVEKKKQRSEKRNPLIIKSIENATAAITTKIKPNVYVFSLSHTHRWFGMFRFKRSQRTSNCRNMIYCFMLTRIIVQFCIQFLKTWPHYLIYWRFSYRFTNSNEK